MLNWSLIRNGGTRRDQKGAGGTTKSWLIIALIWKFLPSPLTTHHPPLLSCPVWAKSHNKKIIAQNWDSCEPGVQRLAGWGARQKDAGRVGWLGLTISGRNRDQFLVWLSEHGYCCCLSLIRVLPATCQHWENWVVTLLWHSDTVMQE